MSKTKTTTKAAASKATKSAKAPKTAPAKKAKVQQTGDAPRSQLDLDETKKLEAARAKKAKTKASDNGEAKTKKVSAIDAAAKLLAGSKEPMGCKEMIETLAAKGIWTSPGGKTPHATLYSAILREINEKGKEARFVKTERGRFAANG
jgi:hypothetical protein